jgi:hypothetical protein
LEVKKCVALDKALNLTPGITEEDDIQNRTRKGVRIRQF